MYLALQSLELDLTKMMHMFRYIDFFLQWVPWDYLCFRHGTILITWFLAMHCNSNKIFFEWSHLPKINLLLCFFCALNCFVWWIYKFKPLFYVNLDTCFFLICLLIHKIQKHRFCVRMFIFLLAWKCDLVSTGWLGYKWMDPWQPRLSRDSFPVCNCCILLNTNSKL